MSGRDGTGTGDGGRHFPLLLSLILLFLLHPFLEEIERMPFFRLAVLLVLVFAIYALSGRRRHLFTALALGTPAMVAQAFAFSAPGKATLLASAGLGLVFLGFALVMILTSVLAPGKITRDRIAGAISVYLLLGLLWAFAYGMIAAANSTAFHTIAEITAEEYLLRGSEFAFLYFSFVTLTTVGYGDITPVSPTAQTLTWMEAVVGQLYLAITLARLVALAIQHRDRPEA